MIKVELRVLQDRIDQLRALARRLAYQKNCEMSWADLAREGLDLVLARYGEVATKNTTEEVR